MRYLDQAMDYLCSERGLAPNVAHPTRNRVDIEPRLLTYHETSKGPKPRQQKTEFLPTRTRVITTIFDDIGKAQTEAYYEEINTIPAQALGLTSQFIDGHWYVVHPVTYWQVREWSNKVLQDLQKWIEEDCPNDLFTSKANQVVTFKNKREESLEEIYKELEKRNSKGGIGKEAGYTGDWEVVGEEEEFREEVSDKVEVDEGKSEKSASRHTEAALEAAAEAGRRAAEEAKILDEYEFA